MTLGDVANKARALTHSDTVSYTAANLLIDINIWYQKAVSMILESNDEASFDDNRNTTYPIFTAPLAANQRDYAVPISEKVLKMKRLDVTYDGINWYKAEPFDIGTFPYGYGTNDTQLDQNFIREQPRYDWKYSSIWVYPMPLSSDAIGTAAIRAEWERQITPFTASDYSVDPNDSTVVPGFDDDFHGILSAGAAFEYAMAGNYPTLSLFAEQLQDWEQRIRTAYGRRNLDRRMALQTDGDLFNSYT